MVLVIQKTHPAPSCIAHAPEIKVNWKKKKKKLRVKRQVNFFFFSFLFLSISISLLLLLFVFETKQSYFNEKNSKSKEQRQGERAKSKREKEKRSWLSVNICTLVVRASQPIQKQKHHKIFSNAMTFTLNFFFFLYRDQRVRQEATRSQYDGLAFRPSHP